MHASAAVCQCTAGTTGFCRRLRRHRHCPHSLSRADRRLPHGLGANDFVVHQEWHGPSQENLAIVTGFGNCDFSSTSGVAISSSRSQHGGRATASNRASAFPPVPSGSPPSLAVYGRRALEAYCTSATESLSARYRRVAHSSFLWASQHRQAWSMVRCHPGHRSRFVFSGAARRPLGLGGSRGARVRRRVRVLALAAPASARRRSLARTSGLPRHPLGPPPVHPDLRPFHRA